MNKYGFFISLTILFLVGLSIVFAQNTYEESTYASIEILEVPQSESVYGTVNILTSPLSDYIQSFISILEPNKAFYTYGSLTIYIVSENITFKEFKYYDIETGIDGAFPNRTTAIEFVVEDVRGSENVEYVNIEFNELGYEIVFDLVDYETEIYENEVLRASCAGLSCTYENIEANLSVSSFSLNGLIMIPIYWGYPDSISVGLTIKDNVETASKIYSISVTKKTRIVIENYTKTINYSEPAYISGKIYFEGTTIGVDGERIDVYANGEYIDSIYSGKNGNYTIAIAGLPEGYYHIQLDPVHGDAKSLFIGVIRFHTGTTITYSMPINITLTMPSISPPALTIERPGLYSVHSLLVLALFLGLFVIYSRLFTWTQALTVSSAMCLIISILLIGNEMVYLFIILFVVGIATWKALGK